MCQKHVFVEIYPSAARTATPATVDQRNYGHRGIVVTLDITAVTSDPSLTLTIEGKDRLSGKYYTILSGSAETGTTTKTYTVYPGVTASANVAVSNVLPETWRVKVTHGDTDSATYSVGASLIP